MLQFEELRLDLEKLKLDIKDLTEALKLDQAKNEISLLEKVTSSAEFWDDPKESQKILKRVSELKAKINDHNKLLACYEDTLALIELADEEGDISLLDEAKREYENFKQKLEGQKLAVLLTGEFDSKNAILTLHAGAGGTEAQDWVKMLYRMYCRWCERHQYKVKTLDYLDGEEAGLKSVSILVTGTNAYGYLKGEAGVHRLVRISPFDSSGRRHTSFASAEVIPEFDDEIEVEISSDDLKMDVFRSSGAGGQHVNKTSSAVRLTHIPTGIVASCQNERSQHQNREVALKMIKSKLMEIKQREHLEKIEDIKGVQKEIGWGSQIRSYIFMPYTLAKDHITEYEVGNINAVMDGEIDGFINAYLKKHSSQK
ncbi:MAG: peptide chain release factor 2 [Oscillospiraceae bacterium]|jgi:peptide chain release factor 2|nr:peptide chain release factor 2 [Oscillospiraceae bacterium]